MNRKRCLVITVIAVATVLLLASSCTTSANDQPIIASLEPEAEWVVPLGSLQVVCTASDPDGDELSYDWSASAGEVSGDGDTVTWTAPASEGSYSVAVAVTDGHGGEVLDYVTITVRANNPLTIASLTADAEWTTPSGSVRVTCTASDPDGDDLSYEWSASGGDISGTGAVVNWSAPQEVGTYDITVVVGDGHGSSATDSLPISVVTGQPPNIEALNVTAEHCYLKAYSGGYYVGKGQEYDIECIAADTNIKLFYEWSCTGGELSGEGSLVTWAAPDASVEVTVTVIVSDISGSMASENIILTVVSCSPCFFGC
ncbi:MAG: PKD domain-containing protein [Dehalococcoidia bacterium]|nr:PKD domain-containing protein [Dehalococcoidia bacterium]MDH4292229.1 PKD domain-containing protein [Dehalococcoidia bacterium]